MITIRTGPAHDTTARLLSRRLDRPRPRSRPQHRRGVPRPRRSIEPVDGRRTRRRRPRSPPAKSAMSVTNTVVLATSANDAPQSPSTAATFARAWVACAAAPPSTMRQRRRVEPDLTREHDPVARAHRGAVRTGDRRRIRSGNGRSTLTHRRSIREARVPRAGNVSGRSPSARASAFHVAAATAANTASELAASGGPGASTIVTSMGGTSFGLMMPNERIVRSCTSPVVGIDGEALGEHPSQSHVRGTDRVRAQHHVVERIAGGRR